MEFPLLLATDPYSSLSHAQTLICRLPFRRELQKVGGEQEWPPCHSLPAVACARIPAVMYEKRKGKGEGVIRARRKHVVKIRMKPDISRS